MQERALLLLSADGRALEWLVPGGDGRPRLRGIGKPPPAAEVIGLLAAPALSVRWLNAPARGREKWRGAARFALEEQLAEDLDSLHIALPERLEAGTTPVAVVRSDWFARWLASARAEGFQLVSVLPVAALLDAEHRVTIDGLTTLRQAGVGCTIEPDLLAFAQPEAGVEVVGIDDPLAWLAGRLRTRPAPELLSGALAGDRRGERRHTPWLWAAGLLAAALVLELGQRALSVSRLQAQEAALEAEVEQLLKTALGAQTPRIAGSERQQLQNELNRRGSGAGSGEGGMLGLLAAVGPVLASETRIKLKGLEYRDAALDLSLEGGDVRSFDLLRERLLGVPELQTEVGDLNYGKATVTGRIRIERRAASSTPAAVPVPGFGGPAG